MSVSTRPYIDPVEGLIARAKQTAAPLNLPSDAEEWRAWHERTLRQVREMIGAYPDPVPLNVEVVERHDEGSYIREKVLYDSEEFATVPAWLFTPKDIKEGEKRPAILCAHGHGRGKDDPAGILPPQDDPNYAQMKERQSGVNYAQQLAEHGYVCLAPIGVDLVSEPARRSGGATQETAATRSIWGMATWDSSCLLWTSGMECAESICSKGCRAWIRTASA